MDDSAAESRSDLRSTQYLGHHVFTMPGAVPGQTPVIALRKLLDPLENKLEESLPLPGPPERPGSWEMGLFPLDAGTCFSILNRRHRGHDRGAGIPSWNSDTTLDWLCDLGPLSQLL